MEKNTEITFWLISNQTVGTIWEQHLFWFCSQKLRNPSAHGISCFWYSEKLTYRRQIPVPSLLHLCIYKLQDFIMSCPYQTFYLHFKTTHFICIIIPERLRTRIVWNNFSFLPLSWIPPNQKSTQKRGFLECLSIFKKLYLFLFSPCPAELHLKWTPKQTSKGTTTMACVLKNRAVYGPDNNMGFLHLGSCVSSITAVSYLLQLMSPEEAAIFWDACMWTRTHRHTHICTYRQRIHAVYP